MKKTLVANSLAGLALFADTQQQIRANSVVEKIAAQSDSPNVYAAEFRAFAEQWRQVYNGKDAARFAPMYTADAEYISAHVAGYSARGREAVLVNFQNGMNSGGYLDAIEILSIASSCDLATVVCRYMGMSGGQKVDGRNLLVCKKINGKWLIATHMTVVRD